MLPFSYRRSSSAWQHPTLLLLLLLLLLQRLRVLLAWLQLR